MTVTMHCVMCEAKSDNCDDQWSEGVLVDHEKDRYMLSFCKNCTDFLLRKHKNERKVAKIIRNGAVWSLVSMKDKLSVYRSDGFFTLEDAREYCAKHEIDWEMEEL